MNKPILIIFAGLIGTGKSTLSKILSKKLDIPIISSDIVRKALSGISPIEHRYEDFKKGIYSKEFTERTYAEMLKRAHNILEKNSSVILDASFQKKSDRKMVLNMADELGIKVFVVETLCKDEDIKKRLNTRINDKRQASDGRWEIYSRQKEVFETILAPAHIKQGDEIKEGFHIIIDTTEPVDVCIEKILERLIHD